MAVGDACCVLQLMERDLMYVAGVTGCFDTKPLIYGN